LPERVELHAMHVLPPIQMPVMMEPHFGSWDTVYALNLVGESEEIKRKRETKLGEAILARTRRPLERRGIDSTPVLVRGDAATEIMDYVKAEHMDLIVAGSLGLSNLRSLWVGSVSRKLVHYSDCSVLLVKGPEKE
jgi:nucleotide-binding universal stress UspA family protein